MDKARMAVYAMGGFYILYLAYKMFASIPDTIGYTHILMIVFSILFLILGVFMLGFGLYKGYKLNKESQISS